MLHVKLVKVRPPPEFKQQSGGMILRVEFVPEHLGLGVPVAHAGLLDLRETISAAGKIVLDTPLPFAPKTPSMVHDLALPHPPRTRR